MDSRFLPDLGSGNPSEPEWLQALKRRKIEGQIGPVDYELGLKKLQAEAQIKDMLIKAIVDKQMNWQVNAQKPLFGGNLELNAMNDGTGPSYRMQWGRRF